MKKKLSGRFLSALILFSLIGQVAWVVENMYFNVFIYKIWGASAADISLMVAASAASATLTTVFIGALSDKLGKRKLFISGGYILWGISIFSFALIRTDVLGALFPSVVSSASLGISLVIIMDSVMTFFGSSANDAAFNAWLTDSTDSTNRGAAEGINAMMPLVAILAVFGGFMAFDLDLPKSWSMIFVIIGAVVTVVGIAGIFLIKEPPLTPCKTNYLSDIVYGFRPRTARENASLYLAFAAFVLFNISIQIFMPYLIIYYEVSLGMADYVLVMAPAIILASAVTALWGKAYDKLGFRLTAVISTAWLAVGYVILYFARSTAPVFIGSLFMMSGYLSGMAVFGAKIRDNTPEGKAGRLQGMRIFSQVLVPGIIGPFIGKTVLANADTVIGSDGTASFVPSADIFAAALVPALLLVPIIFLVTKKDRGNTVSLKTPYQVGEPPMNEYPRPQMKRDSFINLNGAWSLTVKKGKKTKYSGSITVPFPPESEASGVGRITKKGERLIYGRSFCYNRTKPRALLHIGAADCEAEVYINGVLVASHKGGYLPFGADVTDKLSEGENSLRIEVTDSLSHLYPYGKQRHARGGMWYTPISGIWQTVWLEEVSDEYISDIRITPTLSSVTVETTGGTNEKTLTLEGREYRFTGSSVTIELESPRLWTPDDPQLYRFTLSSGDDRLESYFALREMRIGDAAGKTYILLNGKPYFFNGLLDQGYYPDGIFLPASPDGIKDDIVTMKKLGFNMLRKHIKIENELFYYYCDTLGMAVFQDMVNNGGYSFIRDTALPTAGLKTGFGKHAPKPVSEIFLESARETAKLLYNHPSVVYYTVFNEGWGQHDSARIYDGMKKADPTRIWDTASGWFKTDASDVTSEHIYFKPIKLTPSSGKPPVLSEFGGYSCSVEGHMFNPDNTYGYKDCADSAALTAGLEALYLGEIVPEIKASGLCAAVLTQLSDVEDETNGLVTYDRQIVKPDIARMQAISEALTKAFAETVGE